VKAFRGLVQGVNGKPRGRHRFSLELRLNQRSYGSTNELIARDVVRSPVAGMIACR
jgi:hypothetical protein